MTGLADRTAVNLLTALVKRALVRTDTPQGKVAGVQFDNVPTSSSGQATQAVVAGDSVVSVDGISPLLPLVKSGHLKVLAVASTQVLPGLEHLPLAKDTARGLELTR